MWRQKDELFASLLRGKANQHPHQYRGTCEVFHRPHEGNLLSINKHLHTYDLLQNRPVMGWQDGTTTYACDAANPITVKKALAPDWRLTSSTCSTDKPSPPRNRRRPRLGLHPGRCPHCGAAVLNNRTPVWKAPTWRTVRWHRLSGFLDGLDAFGSVREAEVGVPSEQLWTVTKKNYVVDFSFLRLTVMLCSMGTAALHSVMCTMRTAPDLTPRVRLCSWYKARWGNENKATLLQTLWCAQGVVSRANTWQYAVAVDVNNRAISFWSMTCGAIPPDQTYTVAISAVSW